MLFAGLSSSFDFETIRAKTLLISVSEMLKSVLSI